MSNLLVDDLLLKKRYSTVKELDGPGAAVWKKSLLFFNATSVAALNKETPKENICSICTKIGQKNVRKNPARKLQILLND